jgi:hypothetical protein
MAFVYALHARKRWYSERVEAPCEAVSLPPQRGIQVHGSPAMILARTCANMAIQPRGPRGLVLTTAPTKRSV